MNETFNTIFNSLKASGFAAPCASDMTGYLISCLSRPDAAASLAQLSSDIDAVVKALKEYQATLIKT